MAVTASSALAAAAATAVFVGHGAPTGHWSALTVALAGTSAVLLALFLLRLSMVMRRWRAHVSAVTKAANEANVELAGDRSAPIEFADTAALIQRLSAERSRLSHELAAANAALAQAQTQALAREDLSRAVAEASELADTLAATVDGVLSIATAAEELSASAAEIAMCAGEALRVSGDAARVIVDATTHVDALSRGSDETARITGLIHGLAERTRVLSLNTTIEADHAGASGRAMRVIATQIRALAEDAAKGTVAIRSTLDSTAHDIAQVSSAITKVTQIAEEVQHYQAAIGAAVEEQTVVTGDIARSAHQAEMQGADVSRRLQQLAADLASATGDPSMAAAV